MLVRHFRVGAWVAGLAASTWALSAPSQNYALTDLWPTEFITWSLAPYLLLLALRVLDASGSRRWIDAVGFGLVAGLIAGNGHTGHVPVFFVSLAVMCAADARLVARRLPELVLATFIGAAIAAPTLTHLLSEVGRFPELGRLTGDVALAWSALLDAVLRPLSLTSPGELLTVGGERGTRVPFFGGPMLLLAFAYVVQLVRTEPYRRSLVLAFVSAFAFTLAPSVGGAAALSAMFLFRDPMILFGIVMACVALQATASRRPRTATAIGALQLAVLFAAAWPFVTEARSSCGLSDTFLQHSATTTALQGWTERLPGRWYIAPQLDEAIRRGYLTGVGLSPEVWTYRGLPVVNGTFKGVHGLPPPARRPACGRTAGPRASRARRTTVRRVGSDRRTRRGSRRGRIRGRPSTPKGSARRRRELVRHGVGHAGNTTVQTPRRPHTRSGGHHVAGRHGTAGRRGVRHRCGHRCLRDPGGGHARKPRSGVRTRVRRLQGPL